MQLALTMSAAKEADQETLAGANRRHRFVPLRVHGVAPHHSSVLFVCGPLNVTYMMIANEDAAFFGAAHRALTFLKPAVHQQGRYRTPSPNVGTRIEGIAQNIADQALRRNLPHQPRPLNGVGRQLHLVSTEPLECLTHAPQFSKLGEHKLNRFADPSVGMKRNLTHGVSGIPNRESFEQFAAARFRLLPCQQSLAYDLEFHNAERSFDAQHQLIVEIIQIVDLLLVSDKRSKDLTHLEQPTPIFVGAGEPRYFPAADDTDLSQCYQAEHPLEAFALGGGDPRARSQVTIDDLDLLPAQSTHPFGHRILEKLTFLILSHLSFAGLPKVDDRLASQVLRFDLGTV